MTKFYKKFLAAACLAIAANFGATAEVQTLFGYQMSVPQWSDGPQETGFITITSENFATVNFLKKTSTQGAHLSAGEYVDGKLYAYTVEWSYFGGIEPVAYEVYDAETYNKLSSVSLEGKQRVIDLTYDYTTNTMYALAEDEYANDETTGKTSLYIADMKTGELTLVGDPGELKAVNGYGNVVDNHLVTLAANDKGELYAMSEFRYFFKINKFTGAASQVGEQSKVAVNNDFQSMCFGTDGLIYWAQKHPDYGYLTTIDATTGVQTKLGTLGDNAEVTALFIKKEMTVKNFPLSVENLTAVNPEGTNSVKLSWKLPTLDYAGNAANVTAVRIYRLGTEEVLAELPAGTSEFTDTKAANGTNYYSVSAISGEIVGVPATVSVFAGYDQLKAVNNLHAVKDDETGKVTITWEAPTETVNGGYADYNNLTYNVYRVNLTTGNYIRISENQKALTCEDTLTESAIYCYVVEAVSGGVLGLAAQSEDITVATEYTAPVTFTFENEADAFFWTIKNDPNHSKSTYGWSITKGYASDRLDGNFAALASGNAQNACNDWLISPAIKLSKGTYYLNYSAGGSKYLDSPTSWEIFIGENNEDTSAFKTSLDRHENEVLKGWITMTEKSFTVDHDGVYYLGIYGFTTTTFTTMRLDNISVTDTSLAGVDDNVIADNSIEVANNIVTVVAAKGVAAWNIINIAGQTVKAGNGEAENTVEISLDDLSAGAYIISATTLDGAHLTSKVLVK